MKSITKYILTFLLIGGLSIGCNKDYLEVDPTQQLSSEQIEQAAENNPDILKALMNGAYTMMFEPGTGGTDLDHDDFGQKGYDIYSDMLSGDLALSVSTYGWYRGITELTTTVDYTSINNYKVWRYYYRIIRTSNSIIKAAGGNDAIPELEENQHILGQAKALRAYAYFYLAQFFQEKYDPAELILPIYTDPDQPNQPKSSAADVYSLILNDLNSAASLLETFTRNARNEIDLSVVYGLMAYTYGAQGDYDNMKTYSNLVITTGNYSIVSSEEALGGFNNVNTSDWMWGVDITTDNGIDLVSWWGQMDIFTYSYQWAGDKKAMDQSLFDAISDDDVRKQQFLDAPGTDNHLIPYYKFYDPDREIGGQRVITTDYIYMRVAEMYLLNAEASAMTGDEATAKDMLKSILELRIPDTSYIDALAGQDLIDEIYLQTRIELWGEGKSYLAMKRNKAIIKRGSNHLSNVGVEISYDDDRLTFEIPQSEIQNNPFINE
ncbi:MAG: RagB/SusD family nutrient uptake outer membrane protein [Flavobacteriia bacterium]|nr:MAG: RagB/SusD family nutrient uptake outer membrane protein [Flavobacteriia bacterium]